MARIEALANPLLLQWGRRSAGLGLEDAARRLTVKSTALSSWEAGESRPTFNQLRKMASLYKRPVAVFFLTEPPSDFQVLRDFRRMPGVQLPRESPELVYEIRRAHERRELALELFELAEDEEPPLFSRGATLDSDPEDVGRDIRRHLGVTLQQQMSWPAGYDSFNGWRRAIERSGVLVFQAADVPLEEMRGFSIFGERLPAIVVNIKDSVRGRTFTLLHEFAHLLLRQAGLCLLSDVITTRDETARIEVFCNHVAGATLVPSEALSGFDAVSAHYGAEWSDTELAFLANRFGASREALLRRLLILGRTSQSFYEKKRDDFAAEYETAAAGRSGGFAPPHRMAIATSGATFVRLVLTNYSRDSITASDVADFLGVRLKHLRLIEAEVPAVG